MKMQPEHGFANVSLSHFSSLILVLKAFFHICKNLLKGGMLLKKHLSDLHNTKMKNFLDLETLFNFLDILDPFDS